MRPEPSAQFVAQTCARPSSDTRFEALVGEEGWARLPHAVRRRFAKRLGAGDVLQYAGYVEATTLSRVGWLLAQAARLVGAPLPLSSGGRVAASVTVIEDPAIGGQTWSRTYARPGGFPQVIHSAKRFSGATGLEEYVGRGLVMVLRVSEESGALVFRSAGYELEIGGVRLRLPAWLEPGAMTIRHQDLGGGSFAFELCVDHPVFGCLLAQRAIFRDGGA